MSQPKPKSAPKVPKTIENRKARHEYELLEIYEAGVVLAGSEVKSVALGKVNMVDAYVLLRSKEMWLMNLDIEPYEHASNYRPERRRDRKLLLHRKEIELIGRKSQEKGLLIIPTKMYFRNGKAKVEICLARGKKQYDKRAQLKKDETRREIERMRNKRE